LSPVVARFGRGMTINKHINGVGKEYGRKEERKLWCERDKGTEEIRCEGHYNFLFYLLQICNLLHSLQ
jgi:hypothetical protein